jgi:hypothetical protein
LRNITPNPVDLNGHNVFFVLVEKSITQSSLMGNNGDTEFVYVARQILPTASGIPLTKILAPGEELTISDIVWENNSLILPNANNAAIAVFVQSREAANQQVIQSRLYTHATAIPEPDIVTGVEDPMLAEKIQLYPVPANQTVHLLLPVPVLATTPLEVMDMQGRIMYSGTLAGGEQQATFDVSGWANGIYLLTLKTGDTLVRKKILVMQSGSR